MNIEDIQAFCKKLPGVKEDIKWGADLCFCIVEKLFCVVPLEGELSITLKVRDDEFDELVSREGIIPAKYLARNKWITVKDVTVLNRKELEGYIKQSYEIVKSKLPRKLRK
jgi:predicted DNA-binding protein (MmcQ/YjbR family)